MSTSIATTTQPIVFPSTLERKPEITQPIPVRARDSLLVLVLRALVSARVPAALRRV